MIWDIFVSIFAIAAVLSLYLVTIYKRDKKNYAEWEENQKLELEYERAITPKFNASEYMERIEKASLKILEERQPVSQVITLWWGLDGLQMNEDGSAEWVSRRKPKPLPDVWSMCQATTPIRLEGMSQAPQDEIEALKKQLNMMNFDSALQLQMRLVSMSLQSCEALYPSYLNCGHMYLNQQIEQCCCNRLL